jgi:4-carboxymuconolactone decarboxylase
VSATTPPRSAVPPVRVAPLPAEHWDAETEDALKAMLPRSRRNPEQAGNALATMVNHPALTKAFLPLNVHLLFSSTLPARERELVILRVAHLRDCAYEWAHHVDMGLQVGLSDADIAAAAGDATAANPFDGVLLAAVDELHHQSRISDETWAALGAEFDVRQRMDLVFTVGTYGTLALTFNTLGIQLDQDLEHDEDLHHKRNEG